MPKFKPHDIVLLAGKKLTGRIVVAYRIMHVTPWVGEGGKLIYYANGIRADGRDYGPVRCFAEDQLVLREEV